MSPSPPSQDINRAVGRGASPWVSDTARDARSPNDRRHAIALGFEGRVRGEVGAGWHGAEGGGRGDCMRASSRQTRPTWPIALEADSDTWRGPLPSSPSFSAALPVDCGDGAEGAGGGPTRLNGLGRLVLFRRRLERRRQFFVACHGSVLRRCGPPMCCFTHIVFPHRHDVCVLRVGRHPARRPGCRMQAVSQPQSASRGWLDGSGGSSVGVISWVPSGRT